MHVEPYPYMGLALTPLAVIVGVRVGLEIASRMRDSDIVFLVLFPVIMLAMGKIGAAAGIQIFQDVAGASILGWISCAIVAAVHAQRAD